MRSKRRLNTGRGGDGRLTHSGRVFTDSMTMSTEGFGPDSVFATPAEDNGQYRISRSLVRSAEGSTVPLTRVKCLVSMTTPHDIRLHGSAVTPAFVEFDTSLEGFGLVSSEGTIDAQSSPFSPHTSGRPAASSGSAGGCYLLPAVERRIQIGLFSASYVNRCPFPALRTLLLTVGCTLCLVFR